MSYQRRSSGGVATATQVHLSDTIAPYSAAQLTPRIWLDMDTITGADGASITAQSDLSGNQNNTIGLATLRAGSHALNGRKYLNFNGTTTGFTSNHFTAFPSKRGVLFSVFRKGITAAGVAICATFDQSGTTFLWYAGEGGDKWFDGSGFSYAASHRDLPYDWQFQAMVRDGDTSLKFYANGVLQDTFTIANNQPTDFPLYIGQTASGGGDHDFVGDMQILGALDAVQDLTALTENISRNLAATQVVVLGNSIPAGYGLSTPNVDSWPAQVRKNYTGSFMSCYVTAVVGEQTNDIIANIKSRLDSTYSSFFHRRVVVIEEIINALYHGSTAQQAYDQIVQLCQLCRGRGYKVIVMTPTPRNDAGTPGTYEADRQTVRSNMLANYRSFADYICDIGGAAGLGSTSDLTGPNYQDQVHPTAAGALIIANLAVPILMGIPW